MLIRQATINELKVVQDLNYKLFVHDYGYDPVLDVDWPYSKEGEEYFTDKVSGKSGICFIALEDDKLVGYIAGSMMKPDSTRSVSVASLDNMLVEEEYRGNGIGTSLLEHFKKWAKAKGAGSVEVSAYFNNKKAIRFYQSVGFKKLAINLEKKI